MQCAAKNCERKQVSKGHCLMHYKRLKNHGDANYIRRIMKREECSADGCHILAYARALCKLHYSRFTRKGTTTPWEHENKFKKHDTLEEAFFARIDKNKFGCWEWNGSRHMKMPYGKLWFKGKCYLAHRISYEIHKGEIPAGMHVMHIVCDNPVCVRPDHLAIGTHLDNMRDCAKKGRTGYKKGIPIPQMPPRPGDANPNAKVTNIQAAQIREKFRRGIKASLLMQEYRLSKTQIYRYRKESLEGK